MHLNEIWLYERDQIPPVHAANLVANSDDTAYGVESIVVNTLATACTLTPHISITWQSWRFGALSKLHQCVTKGKWFGAWEFSMLEQAVEQIMVLPVVLEGMAFMWRHYVRWPLLGILYVITLTRGHFGWHGLTLTPTWVSNYFPNKVWDEVTCPFTNFNGATVEVCEWISDFIPHFKVNVFISPCRNYC